MGYGRIIGKASKQKINVNSWTEAELVVVSEYSVYTLWLMTFTSEQIYVIN